MQNSIFQKAEDIREVIRYLQKFKNATVVIYLDDKVIDSPLFSSHMKDIALLHEAGLKIVLIPGSRRRIDEILTDAKISWSFHNNVRITTPDAVQLIKMASFDVSNMVMTSLAANGITAIIGNWVRSRAKGIIDGLDYGAAGEIDKLQTDAILTVLNNGFIPIFPCIGWNSVGRPYNISSANLAQQIAIALKAEKLFFVMDNPTINGNNFETKDSMTFNENNDIAAMSVEDAEYFIEKNDTPLNIPLELATQACKNGVTRVHLVDGKIDGVLPTEIFSNLGSGTMIYTSNYGKIRPMQLTDIPTVLSIMRPAIEKGKLLPRTEKQLEEKQADYIVYEIDGAIHACSALHFYQGNQAEIAAVAVDENYAHMGIGQKMITLLLNEAKNKKQESVFILTTQAADLFEKIGFKQDTVDSLPEPRKALWTPERNSKVYRYNLCK